MQIDKVTAILFEVADAVILPRHRSLPAHEVAEKSPGEPVTAADREAEELITLRLQEVLDAPVVGEESATENPGLLAALRDAPVAWLLDPLDGTANFVAGNADYAVMAALVRAGETVASWIIRPAEALGYVAERGSGAWRNGLRVHRHPATSATAELRGAALTRFMSPRQRARIEAAAPRFAQLGPGTKCAGVDYPRLVDGALDFILYQRTLPWDHAPGTLLLTEAGGVARRLDGTPYQPVDNGAGLLNAADATCWKRATALLAPAE